MKTKVHVCGWTTGWLGGIFTILWNLAKGPVLLENRRSFETCRNGETVVRNGYFCHERAFSVFEICNSGGFRSIWELLDLHLLGCGLPFASWLDRFSVPDLFRMNDFNFDFPSSFETSHPQSSCFLGDSVLPYNLDGCREVWDPVCILS